MDLAQFGSDFMNVLNVFNFTWGGWFAGYLIIVGFTLSFRSILFDGITGRLDKLISETKSLNSSMQDLNSSVQAETYETKKIHEEIKSLNDWTTSHTFSGVMVSETREISEKLSEIESALSNLKN